MNESCSVCLNVNDPFLIYITRAKVKLYKNITAMYWATVMKRNNT